MFKKILSSCVLGQTVWLGRVSEYCSFSSFSKHVYELSGSLCVCFGNRKYCNSSGTYSLEDFRFRIINEVYEIKNNYRIVLFSTVWKIILK